LRMSDFLLYREFSKVIKKQTPLRWDYLIKCVSEE
jgi:hypothetical protein